MKIFIDGRETDPVEVTFPDLNFGRAGVPAPHEYVIAMDVDELSSEFGPTYEATAEELVRDGELIGEPCSYPPLSDLLRLGRDTLTEIVDAHLRSAIFERYFSSSSRSARYALHTLDSVEFDGSTVRLRGRARPVTRV
jgi:hypothetical protein